MGNKNQDKKLTKLRILIKRIFDGKTLNEKESKVLMESFLNNYWGSKNQSLMGSILGIIQYRNPAKEEILGFLRAVGDYKKFPVLPKVNNKDIISIIGSGKDEFKTFNISTAAAIIAAASGVPVIKPGCKAETSVCGTEDVFEYLGANTKINLRKAIKIIKKINFSYYTPKFNLPHLFKNYIGKVYFFNPLEYGLGLFTGFKCKKILFGISSLKTELAAWVLKKFKIKHGLVVCGLTKDLLLFDEASSIYKTKVSELFRNKINTFDLYPRAFGIKPSNQIYLKQLPTIKDNVNILLRILSNLDNSRKDMVLINAALLVYLANPHLQLKECYEICNKSLSEGKAKYVLQQFIKLSKGL